MKDVIITGGRNYADRDKVANVLGAIDICTLIQGGASGADALAKEYAQLHNISYVTYEAFWKEEGRAAGPKRNARMLEANRNAIVIAFRGGLGTENCIQLACSKGMTVLRVL